MADFAMNACWHCKENAEWRFKDGWGALACADWFEGKCAGEPLDVSPPLGNVYGKGRSLDEGEDYNNWVKARLREVWPVERPT